MVVKHEGTCHRISKGVWEWINEQSDVYEETLTDWILRELKKQCSFFYYEKFTRAKEARNGADWDCWVLDNVLKQNAPHGYHIRVQAKKTGKQSNSLFKGIIQRKNRYGSQIERLINSSNIDKLPALPLYAIYSALQPDNPARESVNNLCMKCDNGVYLALADDLRQSLLKNVQDKHVLGSLCYKLSVLDILDILGIVRIMLANCMLGYDKNLFCHDLIEKQALLPDYLSMYVKHYSRVKDGFPCADESKKYSLAGFVVLDLRYL